MLLGRTPGRYAGGRARYNAGMLRWFRRRPREVWRQWYLVYTRPEEPPGWLGELQSRSPLQATFYRREQAPTFFVPMPTHDPTTAAVLAECRGVTQLMAAYRGDRQVFMELARFAFGLASTQAGVIASPPAARTYFAPDWVPRLGAFALAAHISIHLVPEPPPGDGMWVHSHGLAQFGLPEVEARQVRAQFQQAARKLVLFAGDWMLEGERFGDSHTLEAPWNRGRWAIVRMVSDRQAPPDHRPGPPTLRFSDYDRAGRLPLPGLNDFLEGLGA